MKIRNQSNRAAMLFSAVLAASYGAASFAVEPATEVAPQTEVGGVMLNDGTVATGLIVEKSTTESEHAFIAVSGVIALQAKVVSINHETREVVLVGADGKEFALVASPEIRNLAQVKVGDNVTAQTAEQVTMELVKGKQLQAQNLSAEMTAQADEGALPGRAKMTKSVDIYTVKAIDIEANTFSLENAEGETQIFTARDPANLAKGAVGDSVVVTTTDSLVVEVVPAGAGAE